ncbi:MAG: transrane sensor [Gammaproteobacteria bacterium]|nr:transrane sensor [Gammaproteobacteria bacterium]
MKQTSDELSAALEALRGRPIVSESRQYAHEWRARGTSTRRFVLGAAVAVCVVACFVFGIPRMAPKTVFATGVGETRPLVLDDGSRILLDTQSRLRVVFTAGARDIELLEGQAHFEVAKDTQRPFRVRTGSAEVVAVGTRFDVATLPARTTVTLIEGRVNVRTLPSAAHAEPQVAAMVPGQQLGITSDGQLLDQQVVKIENVTAWQRGTIVLDDVPLPDALAAMNRYSATQIVIPAPWLQSRRVSGVFRVGDVETEALALQRYFGLRETSHSEREIVLGRN